MHGKEMGRLFWSFAKVGPTTFGGGYAMIPAMQREVVDRRRWMTEDEMNGALSVAGAAPGGIGVNAAAFIGYRLGGWFGASAAVTAITLPTFLIIIFLCIAFASFQNNVIVASAFEGIHGAIIALILAAAWKMGRKAIVDRYTLLFMAVTVLLLIDFRIHPLLLIAAGLVAGIAFVKVREWLGKPIALEDDGNGCSENLFGDGI